MFLSDRKKEEEGIEGRRKKTQWEKKHRIQETDTLSVSMVIHCYNAHQKPVSNAPAFITRLIERSPR